jgi:hypothetical protein
MRTLVISDLHLGSITRRDVLRRPAALEALLGALDGVDRLVLLGDTVELLEGAPRRAHRPPRRGPSWRSSAGPWGAGGRSSSCRATTTTR